MNAYSAWALRCGILLAGFWAVPAHPSMPGLHGERSAATDEAAEVSVYQQFEPTIDIAKVYARVSAISFSMASVPDPRVPRHRRAYDLSIAAVMQGMQDSGYSLDRYSFPWQAVLSGEDKHASAQPVDDCQYGILLFRRDAWRGRPQGSGPAAPYVRAIYVVPETATYGVPVDTAHAAMQRILEQTGMAQVSGSAALRCAPTTGRRVQKRTLEASAKSVPPVTEMKENAAAATPDAITVASVGQDPAASVTGRLSLHPQCGKAGHVVFSGPHFSGSLDSLMQLKARAAGSPPLCAISPSATVNSNHLASMPGGLEFHSLAVDDDAKLAALWRLAQRLGADSGEADIVVLHDTSLFGGEICSSPPLPNTGAGGKADPKWVRIAEMRSLLCSHSHRISYPSNIADIRAALQPAAEVDASLARKMALGSYLPLDHGAGNGSEFPDGRQSRLTAAGGYLQLQRVMGVLRNLNPQLVIVVGTDVRDRLFLFEQLREALPSAQLADLEADTLSGHPQYIHATRGAVLTASERITWFATSPEGGVSMAVGATDTQMLHRALIRGIDAGDGWKSRSTLSSCGFLAEGQPLLHVVGRKSVLPIICPSPKELYARVFVAPVLAALSFVLLLMTAPVARIAGSPESDDSWQDRAYLLMQKAVGLYDPAINRSTVLALLAMTAMLSMVGSFALLGKNHMLSVIGLVVAPVYCWALAYLAGVFDTLERSRPRSTGLVHALWTRHKLALASVALAASAAALWLGADQFGRAVMVRLGFSASFGMALCIALMLAILLLLLADSALAVAKGASRRNARVLVQALGLQDRSDEHTRLKQMFSCSLLPLSSPMAIGIIALALCVLYALPVKLTVFGKPASVLALVCVIAMSYVSLLFLSSAIRIRQRVIRMVALLRDAVRAAEAVAGGASEAVGLWPPKSTAGVRFASTPAVARVQDGGRHALHLLTPAGRRDFRQALSPLTGPACGSPAEPLPREARLALFVLLASEVSLVRWATFCGVASCLAVAGFVYLYPVSGADAFILFNLAVLALTGLFAGHTAMSFERNDVMSNLLCNRGAKTEWSGTLFNYIAVPFVVLAIVIAITQIPGVINLGGGMFDSTLKKLTMTLFGGL